MEKRIFQMGGEESNFFMDYLDLLEASNTEEPTYQESEQMQGMPEEGSDFISNLTKYDEEVEKEASIEERISGRLNEYIAKIDQMLEGMTGQAMEQGLFDDFDENEEALTFDTRVNPAPFYGKPIQAPTQNTTDDFSGIFRVEGAKTGQPTNLNSSAIGRGQMIKGTRMDMYKKLGITDIAKAEQMFKTDPDFEMQVLNAYKDELDKRIPASVTGEKRRYMIAKGWYTGDVNYPDDKVPGKSAGNKLTAGEYALKSIGYK